MLIGNDGIKKLRLTEWTCDELSCAKWSPHRAVVGHGARLAGTLSVRDLWMLQVSPDNIADWWPAPFLLEPLADPNVVIAGASIRIGCAYVGGLIGGKDIHVAAASQRIKTWKKIKINVIQCTVKLLLKDPLTKGQCIYYLYTKDILKYPKDFFLY